MRLTTIHLVIVLIAPACAPLVAQDSQPDIQIFTPPSEVPKPFDWTRFKLLVPPKPAPASAIVGNDSNKPCAVVRTMRPRPSIDRRIAPGSQKPGLPVEANSKDITELNVPAPSCLDLGRNLK